MKRIATGDPGLDRILCGGFPRNSNILLMGQPGTGKTVLAEQMAFEKSDDRPTLYLTTLSEPLSKVLAYLQEFEFADVERVGADIFYESLAEVLTEDPARLVGHVTELIQQHRPSLVIIDSFKAVGELVPDPHAWRLLVFDLASLFSAYDTTSLWIGEYSPEAVTDQPEFAVADGILFLDRVQRGTSDERYLRVVKLRGSDFRDGEHVFDITSRGLRTSQRLVGPVTIAEPYVPTPERLQTGIVGLDSMIETGWLRGTNTLVVGPSGAGKTMLGLTFLRRGVEEGERALLVNFQENPSQLARCVASLGWDAERLLTPERLDVLYVPPVELQIDWVVRAMYQRLERDNLRRVVIDALDDLRKASRDDRRFGEYVYALTQEMSQRGITAMMTIEGAHHAAQPVVNSSFGREVSNMSDNILLLEMDLGEQLTRSVRILKSRGSAHDGRRKPVRLSSDGFFVGAEA